MSNNDRYVIEILDVALDAIDAMASGDQEYHSPSVLARQLKINRSRLFRILKTLERRGFVDFNPETETYRLGLKFLSVSQAIHDRHNLRRAAEAVLKDLAAQTGDSVHLVVLSGSNAVIVDRHIGGNMLQVAAPVGEALPLHVGASPKLLLAFLPESEQKPILDELVLTPFTPHTITDKEALRQTLKEIRLQGYSIDDQDFEIGVYAFGAPIFDATRQAVAGVTITTPAVRCNPKRRQELIGLVVKAARQISTQMGYIPQPNGDNADQ